MGVRLRLGTGGFCMWGLKVTVGFREFGGGLRSFWARLQVQDFANVQGAGCRTCPCRRHSSCMVLNAKNLERTG